VKSKGEACTGRFEFEMAIFIFVFGAPEKKIVEERAQRVFSFWLAAPFEFEICAGACFGGIFCTFGFDVQISHYQF